MSAHSTKTVCFLTRDRDLAKTPVDRLAAAGVCTKVCAGPEELSGIAGSSADLVIALDTGILSAGQRVSDVVGGLLGLCDRGPDWVCVSRSNDIDLRLQALRAGAKAFFVAPAQVDGLAERLLALSGAADSRPHRILVVDDQPVAALFAARVLERAGMRARVVEDALLVLDALVEFRPDVVLMDLHMPGASGIELTSIIRDHDEFFETPVIFLSKELDKRWQLDALRVGGDDFLPKPVDPQHLIAVIQERIHAAQSQQSRRGPIARRDPVTGLADRQSFLRRLDRVFAEDSARVPGQGVLYIRLACPEGRQEWVEDRQNDALFASAGRVLIAHLEAGESAGRCGDTSFAVIARRTGDDALMEQAQAVRSAVVELLGAVIADPGVAVGVGIGSFCDAADDAVTLLSRAEKAAVQACSAGGQGVVRYKPGIADGSASVSQAHLISVVEHALDEQGLELFYQPIVPLRQASGERYEVALRLRAPGGEYIPAFDFLPAAERGGLLARIDRWVLEQALDRLQRERERHPGLRLFVPQSVATIGARPWLSWFRDQVIERDLLKQRPVLQFRCADVAANVELAANQFAQLNRLGIKICLDRREAEPAAEELISRLPVSLIRLTVSTIDTLGASGFTGLVQGSRKKGLRVVTSGIESPQTLVRAWQCGADFVQGGFLQMAAPDLIFDFTEATLA